MSESKHTAKLLDLPWGSRRMANSPADYKIVSASGECVAMPMHKNRADYTARACNAHYQLLEACKAAVHLIDNIGGYGALYNQADWPKCVSVNQQLKAAIAAAEGGG